jgi:hypothetical protein
MISLGFCVRHWQMIEVAATELRLQVESPQWALRSDEPHLQFNDPQIQSFNFFEGQQMYLSEKFGHLRSVRIHVSITAVHQA